MKKRLPSALCAIQTALLAISIILTGTTAVGAIIIDSGPISVMQPSGGGFLAGTSNFTITAGDIPNIELEANFDIVDAGVLVVVNNNPLFPQFDDISQFGNSAVFGGTGVAGGGVSFPFNQNTNGLPRLTIEATVAGTIFSGAINIGSTVVSPFIPQFATQNLSNLLVAGANQIDFFVLNSFDGANLVGDFTVTQIESVPEPEAGIVSIAVLALLCLCVRRRRKCAY